MTVDPAASGEEKYAGELYPMVAAIAVEYGDPEGTYVNFLKEKAGEADYIKDAYFLWNQPLAGGESLVANAPDLPGTDGTNTSNSGDDTDEAFVIRAGKWFMGSVGIVLVAVLSL